MSMFSVCPKFSTNVFVEFKKNTKCKSDIFKIFDFTSNQKSTTIPRKLYSLKYYTDIPVVTQTLQDLKLIRPFKK